MIFSLICYRSNGYHFECTCGNCPPETSDSSFDFFDSEFEVDIAMLIAEKKFEDFKAGPEYEDWRMIVLVNGQRFFKKGSPEDKAMVEIYAMAEQKLMDMIEDHKEKMAQIAMMKEQSERITEEAQKLKQEQDEREELSRLLKKYAND